MDINFHYFAVKTLAVKAGFPKAEAQIIAEFSQYVDDHDGKFLGLNSAFSEIVTRESLGEAHQKFSISPFHFIPSEVKSDPNDYKQMRTTPAKIGDDQIISKLLRDARTKLASGKARLYMLTWIGTYLHIFADTYAHQGFNGYWSDRNAVKIAKAFYADKENYHGSELERPLLHGRDITKTLNHDGAIIFEYLPSVGHANAGHLPDLTYVEYKLNRDSEYRNNCELAMTTAKEIYDYLCSCSTAASASWDSFAEKLKQVFKKEYIETDMLAIRRHWQGFAGVTYDYNKNAIKARLDDKAHSDESLGFAHALNHVIHVLYDGVPIA